MFISYARVDAEVADRIHAGLEARGISTWMDTKDLRPGSAWLSEIEKAAHSVQAALILVGKQQLTPWQQGELEALLVLEREGRLRIVPTLLPGATIQPEQLPLMLRRLNLVDLRPALTEARLDDLAAGIRGQASARPAPPRPTSRRWTWMVLTGAAVAGGALATSAIVHCGDGDIRPVGVPPARRVDLDVARDARPPAPDSAPDVQLAVRVATPGQRKRTNDPPPTRAVDPRPLLVIQPFDVQGNSPDLDSLRRLLPLKIAGALQAAGCRVVNAGATPGRGGHRARYIITGSAIEAGSLVRLNAQIADARSHALLGTSETSVRAPFFMAGEQLMARELLDAVTRQGLCSRPIETNSADR